MATAGLTTDKTAYTVGDRVVLRPSITGLAPGTPATTRSGVIGSLSIQLSDPDETVTAETVPVTILTPAKPGQTVVSTTVTFDGKTAQRQADGTYTVTA